MSLRRILATEGIRFQHPFNSLLSNWHLETQKLNHLGVPTAPRRIGAKRVILMTEHQSKRSSKKLFTYSLTIAGLLVVIALYLTPRTQVQTTASAKAQEKTCQELAVPMTLENQRFQNWQFSLTKIDQIGDQVRYAFTASCFGQTRSGFLVTRLQDGLIQVKAMTPTN